MEVCSNHLKVYRRGDPLTCQRVWDVIKQLKVDHKPSTIENVIRYCYKSFNVESKFLEKQISFLVEDKLIIQKTSAPSKGSSKGVEHTIFCIPSESEVDLTGTHDWYCFNCHKPGEVLACSSCPRVYHTSCLGNFKKEDINNGFVCKFCMELTTPKVRSEDFERSELNHLLSFACCRLEDKFPMEHYIWNPDYFTACSASFTTERCAALLKKLPKQVYTGNETGEQWRAKYLLRLPMSIPKMNDRADRQVYRSLAQFHMDCLTVVHNVAVFYGEHSSLADSARVMQRVCLYEMEEIKTCPDCYERSNNQDKKDWFCIPCDPPHELVYAKAKGYPFWPAKVLKMKGNLYDVRFFGTGHDRATLDRTYIRPITCDILSLVSKRSPSWVKALEELRKHKAMLSEIALPSSDDEGCEKSCDSKSENESAPNTKKSPSCKELSISLTRISEPSLSRPTVEKDPDSSVLLSSLVGSTAPISTSEVPMDYSHDLTAETANSSTCVINEHNFDDSADARITALEKEIMNLKKGHAEEILLLEEQKNNLLKDIETLKEKHVSEISKLKEEYEHQIEVNKKKHWCSNCGKEGVYHCCFSVSYCSIPCQQKHWKSHHSKICRHEKEIKPTKGGQNKKC